MRTMRLLAVGLAASLISSAAYAQGRPGGGRGFGGPGGGGGGPLQLLAITEVQKELKLDDAQNDLIKAVQTEQQAKMREMFQGLQGGGGNFDRAAMQQKMEALRADETKKVAEILTAPQMTRLKQLQLQQSGARALTQKETQDALKLTTEQKTNVTNLTKAESDATMQLFSGLRDATPEQRQEMMTKMQDARKATDTKLLAVLTEPQKKQFDTMKGAAFTFPERQPRRRNNL